MGQRASPPPRRSGVAIRKLPSVSFVTSRILATFARRSLTFCSVSCARISCGRWRLISTPRSVSSAFSRACCASTARGARCGAAAIHIRSATTRYSSPPARARAHPHFRGSHLPGVLTLRTIQDARRIVDILRGQVRSAVVLGGGALGLEWTHALLERGVKVTLLERAPRFMPSALDGVASDLLAGRLSKAGVDVLLGEEVACLEAAPSGLVGALVTKSGRRVACDLVAAALGIVPNSELLSDVKRTASGAVEVDRTLLTSAPGVWAAGDVASVEGEQLGLWAPARHQGRVAAANMCGASEQYRPGAHYFATRLFDLDFARVGDIGETAHSRSTGRLSARHGPHRLPQAGAGKRAPDGRAVARGAPGARARHRPRAEAADRRADGRGQRGRAPARSELRRRRDSSKRASCSRNPSCRRPRAPCR